MRFIIFSYEFNTTSIDTSQSCDLPRCSLYFFDIMCYRFVTLRHYRICIRMIWTKHLSAFILTGILGILQCCVRGAPVLNGRIFFFLSFQRVSEKIKNVSHSLKGPQVRRNRRNNVSIPSVFKPITITIIVITFSC